MAAFAAEVTLFIPPPDASILERLECGFWSMSEAVQDLLPLPDEESDESLFQLMARMHRFFERRFGWTRPPNQYRRPTAYDHPDDIAP